MQEKEEKKKKRRRKSKRVGKKGGTWMAMIYPTHTSHMDGLDLATLPLNPTILVINTPTPLLVMTIFFT